MTTHRLSYIPVIGTSRRRPVAELLRRFVDVLVEADRRYRERRYLEAMDERMLRDIGITRGDRDRMVRRQPAQVPPVGGIY